MCVKLQICQKSELLIRLGMFTALVTVIQLNLISLYMKGSK